MNNGAEEFGIRKTGERKKKTGVGLKIATVAVFPRGKVTCRTVIRQGWSAGEYLSPALVALFESAPGDSRQNVRASGATLGHHQGQ